MQPATAGSGSSSDLYSASDSDDPLYESDSRTRDRLARRCGLQFRQDVTLKRTYRDITDVDGKVVASPLMLHTGDSEYEDTSGGVSIQPTGRHKRKRVDEDEDQQLTHGFTRPSGAKDSTQTRITFQGVYQATQAEKVVPVTDKSAVKRGRLTESPSGVGHGASVEREDEDNGYDPVAGLPTEIWQHVFCFVPPVFLGRLLRVNRTFKSLLTPELSAQAPHQEPNARARFFHTSEAIWAASRKRFCPGLPKPLRGVNELNMWRLLRGNDCQKCGERKALLTSSDACSPWESGPGKAGVRVIWPFGVRLCGMCLNIHSEKEVTLLFSSTFHSFLLPALPCAFVSQTENFVTSAALRNTIPPSEVQLTKHYYKPHVEQIQRQFQDAQELGSASAEEWVKGLESEGREKCIDAARWELWEAKGWLRKVNLPPKSKAGSSTARPAPPITTSSTHSTARTSIALGAQPNILGTSIDPALNADATFLQGSSGPFPLYSANNPTHGSLPRRPQVPAPQIRHERNIRDVNESKAVRRAEIERRCMALDPPLEPRVLCHMESFQAALQISSALTDQAWEVLKPRLLAQRENAERREQERIQQSKLLQAKSEERKYQESQLKEAKELLDKEWDGIQAPVRDRLATYADEIIHKAWAGGSSVTKDTCAKFAADVLLYSRQRFYDDLAEEDKLNRVANNSISTDSLNGTPVRKLILENMKWLFDNKVKNFTEQFQKELFLCNGCEGNFKFYGFEGVIQHYAAKHTTALSLGSVVVHWRAEWPEQPPFHPNPSAAKAAYYAVPPPMSSSVQPQYTIAPQTTAVYGEYGQTSTTIPRPPQTYGNQFSPEMCQPQYSSQFQNGHHYSQPVPNHYRLGPEYHGQSPAFQHGNSFSAPPPQASNGLVNGYVMHSEIQGNVVQSLPSAKLENRYPHAVQQSTYADGYPMNYLGSAYLMPQQSSVPKTPAPNSFAYADLNTHGAIIPGPDLYQMQMNEMACLARDFWSATSGIKDLPQSVRIHVVIHHMVSRFAQKYSNEPSLAMFIDGLDHNSIMRPVRSLNGLACKTCVTYSSGSSVTFHTHPQHLTVDRKLYTLPHLLNHFKSVHLEKARPIVDRQSGLESSGLDWKQDMIELPEDPLIADLINTPGMDDSKLRLISSAFPGVFPNSLPSIGSVRNLAPIPKYDMGRNDTTSSQHSYELPSEESRVLKYPNETSSLQEEIPQSRPQSIFQPLSRSSTRESEPPGDDEYDPNRPAYYGKIVEPGQFASDKVAITTNIPVSDIYHIKRSANTNEHEGQHEAYAMQQGETLLEKVKPAIEGPYATQLIRHSQRRIKAGVPEHVSNNITPPKLTSDSSHRSKTNNMGDQGRHVSEDGEVVEDQSTTTQPHRRDSPVAEISAAERFLNELNPITELVTDERELNANDHDFRGRPARSRMPDLEREMQSGLVQQVEIQPRRQNEVTLEHSMRSTPSLADRSETRKVDSTRPPQLNNGHPYPYDVQPRSRSHIRPVYNEDKYTAEDHSPGAHDSRGASYIAHEGPDTAGRVLDMHRSLHEPGQWTQRVFSRSRSRSPSHAHRGPERYRVRSPPPAPRHGSDYHVDPPVIPLDSRPQRTIRYAYASDREEFGMPMIHGHLPEQYQQRVEYINIRADPYGYPGQGRYLVSQHPEERRHMDHTRFERSHAGESVYERNGQLYYAGPQHSDPRPVRTIHPGYVEYRDNFR